MNEKNHHRCRPSLLLAGATALREAASRSARAAVGLLLCAAALLPVACRDDLDTSPSAQPTPSADTLRLGTLLAGNPSQTYQLKLYNRHEGEIRLSSVTLREAATSGFRLNVDGMNGSSFTNADLLRIAPGDSLFLFVEATFPEAGEGLTEHRDYIDILCNGRQQTVVLEAFSKDVRKLRGCVVAADTVWERGSEVQVYDSLVVAEGVTLTLEDSVTLYLHDKADVILHGRLVCRGRCGAPVTLRGDRTDNMFDNLAYDGLPAQWGTLYVDSTSCGNVWEWTDVRGMTDGIRLLPCPVDTALTADEDQRLVLRSCRVRNSRGPLVHATAAQVRIENCELMNAGGPLLGLYGGAYEVTHTTLANYSYGAAIASPAVILSNMDTLVNAYCPLYRATFRNCIVWGRSYHPTPAQPNHNDVLPVFYRLTDPDGVPYDSVFHYTFDHCLLSANGTDDDDFIATLWNEDPLYRLIDEANYTYDLRLQPESPAAAAGAAAGAALCPTDLDGRPRPAEAPSLGCYQLADE